MYKRQKIGWMEVMTKKNTVNDTPKVKDIPGITTEQYIPNIQVRWKNASAAEMLIFSRASSVGAWTQSFTGFSFTPTSYSIRVCHDGFNAEILQSEWAVQKDGTIYGRWTQGTGSNSSWPSTTAASTYLARIINNVGTSKTGIRHSSFVSWWIELNFVDSDFDVILEITAYK